MKAKRTKSKRTQTFTLDCGHPAGSNNLHFGECGTCFLAREFEAIARTDPSIKASALGIAKFIRSGAIVYDTRGKSLLDWEKMLPRKTKTP